MKALGLAVLALVWLAALPAWAGCDQAQELLERARSEADLAQKTSLLEEAAETCPGFAAWYALGKAYAKDRAKFPLALGALRDAWNAAGDTIQGATALAKAGQVYEEQGEIEYAVASYKQSLRIFNDLGKSAPKLEKRLIDLETSRAEQILTSKQIKKALSFRSFMAEPALDLRIHFGFDSARLTEKGEEESVQLARALADPAFEGRSFLLIGHTDKQGQEDYNLRLSMNRAGSVMDFLTQNQSRLQGRIRTQGKGETRLLYPGDTEEEHQLNRRVEVRVIP